MGEPVGYTCPLIDGCKDNVSELVQNVDCETDFDRCTMEQLKNLHDAWKDFDWVQFDQDMEEIRSANDQLRTWGNTSEEEATDAKDELENVTRKKDEKISELEDRIAELERELSE